MASNNTAQAVEEGPPDTCGENRQAEHWAVDHTHPIDLTMAGAGRVMHFIALPTGTQQTSGAGFNDELAVSQFRLMASVLRPGELWQPEAEITDRHGVILPADLPAGEYTIRVGLYRSDDQSPVPPGAIELTKISVAP